MNIKLADKQLNRNINKIKLNVNNPKLAFLGSFANALFNLSNSFHDLASTRCLKTSYVSTIFSLCHLISSAVCFDKNNHFNLGFKGKYRRTFWGIFFLFASSYLNWGSLYTRHVSLSSCLSQNNVCCNWMSRNAPQKSLTWSIKWYLLFVSIQVLLVLWWVKYYLTWRSVKIHSNHLNKYICEHQTMKINIWHYRIIHSKPTQELVIKN